MSTKAGMSTRTISKLNANDVEGAALAIVALNITQPELMEEDDVEYANLVDQIYEDYFPLFRVPANIWTPEESKATDAIMSAVQSKVDSMEKKLRSSKDPLLRALAGMKRTTAE